jgi:predicted metalloprotease
VLSQQRAADEAAYVTEVVGGGAGDMAAAFIVAHEFAHSLQSELNFFDGRYTSLQTELQADCWAGVWAASAARRGMLDHDDLSEAAVLAWAVGSPDTADRDHGTSLERVDAFFQGFDTGHPLMCGEYLEAQP